MPTGLRRTKSYKSAPAKRGRKPKVTAEPEVEIKEIRKERPDFYVCPRCGKKFAKLEGNFPISHSPVYKYTKFMPICKNCMNDLFAEYTSYLPEEEAFRRICMKFDLYYSPKLVKMCTQVSSERSKILQYIAKINLVQYQGKSYDTTVEEEGKKDVIKNVDDDLSDVEKKVILFWGTGFSKDDYDYLQSQYDDWTARNECQTKAQEEIFKRLCFIQLNILKANKNNESTKDLDKSYQDYLNTANLQPKQNSGNGLSSDMSMGQLIEEWEKEKPIPEPDPEYQDVDGIKKYISVYFLGHLAKMVGINNKYSKMYEDEISKYTVTKPEYEEDSDSLFETVFGESSLENKTDADAEIVVHDQ